MIKGLIVVCAAAVLLSYLVAPLAVSLAGRVRHGPDRRPMSRSLAILIVFLAGALGAVVLHATIAPRYVFQWEDLQRELPQHAERAIARIRVLERMPQALGLPIGVERSALDVTMKGVMAFEQEVRGVMREVLGGMPFVSWLAAAPLLALVLLEAFPAFRRSTMRAMPNDHLAWRSGEFFQHVNMVLAAYLRAQVISALFVATVTTLLLVTLRVDNGLVLGLAAGAAEFLPVVGPLAIALAVSVMADGTRLVVARCSAWRCFAWCRTTSCCRGCWDAGCTCTRPRSSWRSSSAPTSAGSSASSSRCRWSVSRPWRGGTGATIAPSSGSSASTRASVSASRRPGSTGRPSAVAARRRATVQRVIRSTECLQLLHPS